jgi:FixJ family two-component response regulator
MKSTAVPTVFIIDDDRGVRQAIHDLVESVGCAQKPLQLARSFSARNTPSARAV